MGALRPGLCGDDLLDTNRRPRRSLSSHRVTAAPSTCTVFPWCPVAKGLLKNPSRTLEHFNGRTITSATEVMFSSALVCLFVSRITQNYSTHFHKIQW